MTSEAHSGHRMSMQLPATFDDVNYGLIQAAALTNGWVKLTYAAGQTEFEFKIETAPGEGEADASGNLNVVVEAARARQQGSDDAMKDVSYSSVTFVYNVHTSRVEVTFNMGD